MTHRNPSPEEKLALRALFEDIPKEVCGDCGGFHLRACPRIRRQVWIGQGAGSGVRVEVEYFDNWDDSEVIFPEAVYDEEET